jgi:hypothetical protein
MIGHGKMQELDVTAFVLSGFRDNTRNVATNAGPQRDAGLLGAYLQLRGEYEPLRCMAYQYPAMGWFYIVWVPDTINNPRDCSVNTYQVMPGGDGNYYIIPHGSGRGGGI